MKSKIERIEFVWRILTTVFNPQIPLQNYVRPEFRMRNKIYLVQIVVVLCILDVFVMLVLVLEILRYEGIFVGKKLI